MRITSRGPVVIRQLPEKLSGEQGRTFFLEVELSLRAYRPCVVLDCSKVRQFDSVGVQVLLRCLEEAMKRNGDVKLAAISPAAASILELTTIDRLFEAFDNTSDAVNSFYSFPAHAFEQSLLPEHSIPPFEKCCVTGFEDGRLTVRGAGFEVTMRIAAHWLMRQIAGCLVLFMLVPSVSAATSPEQDTNPNGQAGRVSSDQASLKPPLLQSYVCPAASPRN
jgi:anti-sigma B factor antagonist